MGDTYLVSGPSQNLCTLAHFPAKAKDLHLKTSLADNLYVLYLLLSKICMT